MVSTSPDYSVVHAARERSRIVSGNGLAMGTMLLWAAGFPAAEILLSEWHPLTVMALRLTMALSVLFPLWIMIDGHRPLATANWRRAMWVGAAGFGTGTNLLLFAQWFTDPVTVALVATTTPLSAAVIEVLGRHRRVTARFAMGLLASVAGGVVAIGSTFSPDLGIGVAMAIASGFLFAWASNAAVRDFPELSPVGRSTITFSGAAIFTWVVFCIASLFGVAELPSAIDTQQFGLLAIYSLAAMALSQILFIASVGRLGIALTSFHVNIAPFYVMVMLVALGGAWDWRAAAGAAIVSIGVLIAQDPQNR